MKNVTAFFNLRLPTNHIAKSNIFSSEATVKLTFTTIAVSVMFFFKIKLSWPTMKKNINDIFSIR